MNELRAHADNNKISIAKVILANEMSVAGKTEAEIYAFIDKIINAMVATVKSGLSMQRMTCCPARSKLHSKAATVYKRSMDETYAADKGIGALAAFAIAASEENARGHLVITAPTGGSAGVMPSLVYALIEVRKVDRQKVRDGMLAALAIGYLCKHHATLAAAEGGLPGRDRRCLGNGCGAAGYGERVQNRWWSRMQAESALEHPPGHDLRPGSLVTCRFRASSAALSAPSRPGLPSRSPATRSPPGTGRFRRHRDGSGRDRERHEQQVQGNQRGRPRPIRHASADPTDSTLESGSAIVPRLASIA
jgi:hypothetical protein